MQMKDTRHQLN